MSDQDDDRLESQGETVDETADALRALAGGAEPTPAQAEEAQQAAEADNVQDDANVLAGLDGKGSAPGLAGDGFGADSSDEATADMEAAERLAAGVEGAEGGEATRAAGDANAAAAAALAAADAGPVDLAAELAAHAADRTDPAAELAAAAGDNRSAGPGAIAPGFDPAGAVAPSPEQKRARAVQFDARTRHAHAYQFKKTMIPLLLVVAAVLLIMGTVAVFLPGAPGANQAGSDAASSGSTVQAYRPWLILSAFVVGPILLLGAWMFYLDTRRSDRELAARMKAAEPDNGPPKP